jgi:uncharacterized protein
MYEPRWYRHKMGERFSSLTYRFMETDIWLAFDKRSKVRQDDLKHFIDKKSRSLRELFEDYFKIDPNFKKTFKPLKVSDEAPSIIKRLSQNSFITQVGPMAGIAGAFAEEIAKSCKDEFNFNEMIVENGGDNYLDINSEIIVSLYAGEHPLSGKLQLLIEPNNAPIGLCASSGKFGHSISLGKADLVAVACKDTILADQFATAFANKILDSRDIKSVLEEASAIPQIMHISVFAFDQFGVQGNLKFNN